MGWLDESTPPESAVLTEEMLRKAWEQMRDAPCKPSQFAYDDRTYEWITGRKVIRA